MESFIKSLSKIPSIVLSFFAFVLWFPVFYVSILFGFLISSYVERGPISLLLMFSIFILPSYGFYKLMKWTRKAIDQSIKDSNSSLVADTDIPALCLEMLEAVQQKYRYTNYETKLENYSDWIAFQVKHNRKEMMENLFHAQQEKDLTREFIVTYDNVLIASNKFLGWLLHTNYLVTQFFSAGSFIEINLVSKVLQDDVFDNIQLRIKIGTKAMSLRGKGEFVEIRFALDEKDKPRYEEIVMVHRPFFSFMEKEMEDSDTVEVINFMQKFIKKTRKLIR